MGRLERRWSSGGPCGISPTMVVRLHGRSDRSATCARRTGVRSGCSGGVAPTFEFVIDRESDPRRRAVGGRRRLSRGSWSDSRAEPHRHGFRPSAVPPVSGWRFGDAISGARQSPGRVRRLAVAAGDHLLVVRSNSTAPTRRITAGSLGSPDHSGASADALVQASERVSRPDLAPSRRAIHEAGGPGNRSASIVASSSQLAARSAELANGKIARRGAHLLIGLDHGASTKHQGRASACDRTRTS